MKDDGHAVDAAAPQLNLLPLGTEIARLHVTLAREDLVSESKQPRSSREKVKAHRDRLRRQGLRPIQIWVPDVRAPGFKAEAHRQSVAVAESAHAREDQEFIDAVSELDSS